MKIKSQLKSSAMEETVPPPVNPKLFFAQLRQVGKQFFGCFSIKKSPFSPFLPSSKIFHQNPKEPISTPLQGTSHGKKKEKSPVWIKNPSKESQYHPF
ncbi:unnamed protein product [Allacma fusca]|uniref:Uncharacterized protein n=1 Tax=Allacma fusca TaxID=39272 RepID=A0A8J2PL78_9HEXA|nr:unnamed protein product [Allacma fusca]